MSGPSLTVERARSEQNLPANLDSDASISASSRNLTKTSCGDDRSDPLPVVTDSIDTARLDVERESSSRQVSVHPASELRAPRNIHKGFKVRSERAFASFGGVQLQPTQAPPTEDLDSLRDAIVYEHGEYFDSYLATEPGRQEFWSSTHEGLISYTRRGRFLLIGGGLIASDAHKPVLLKEFTEYLQRQKLVASFHNIGDHELPIFRELGYQVTKWGEEPVLDLGTITWQGKSFEWIRRQTNYCLRQGLVAFEVVPAELTATQWADTLGELQEVAAESISQKPQKEMTFFEGTIGNHEIGRRRIFVVRSEHGFGRIEGFVVCNPMRNGTMWATEMYRRRVDAVRGTMAYLFRFAIDTFQAEGAVRVGMCLDPSLRCSEKLPGDSPLIRLGMTWGESCMALVFDVAGIRHFKSRFRPRYENRYVCVYPKATFSSIFAFSRVSGLFDVKPWMLMKVVVRRFLKRNQRSTLAEIE